ncbi:hypothetical protein bsdtw1_04166 [Clostridium fungisolvens]|uniref:Uncharacterized protein n=1 Tax=Clostridium fungisolvens TaxID=1604897 RepID=A0A6V8SMI1_9CLOT|nr:hypothetical protein bsdtw1_04166 [Clostridium fungisolvens]
MLVARFNFMNGKFRKSNNLITINNSPISASFIVE